MQSEFENKNKMFTIGLEKVPAGISNVPLMKHIEDPYLRATLSACLNHQRAMHKDVPSWLKTIALPNMVYSLSSLPLGILSLQAIDSPPCDGIYHFEEAGNPKSITKRNGNMQVRPSLQVADLADMSNQELTNRVLDLACACTQDMFQHSVKKIVDKAKQVEVVLDGGEEPLTYEDLFAVMQNASNEIHADIGRTANFAIMSMFMAKEMQGAIKTHYDFDVLPINLRDVGVMRNRWRIYVCNDFPDMILMGYRGHHPVDAGVAVAPKDFFAKPKKVTVPLRQSPTGVGYSFNWEGSLTVPRPDYFRVIKLKLSKNDLDTHDL